MRGRGLSRGYKIPGRVELSVLCTQEGKALPIRQALFRPTDDEYFLPGLL